MLLTTLPESKLLKISPLHAVFPWKKNEQNQKHTAALVKYSTMQILTFLAQSKGQICL